MEALVTRKLALEHELTDISIKMSEIRWGVGDLKINLEREVFLLLHQTSIGGNRVLKPNEFRNSEIDHCSHELYYGKIYEVGMPPKTPSTMKNRATGIVSISNGVACVGTIIHEFIQNKLIEKFGPKRIKAERVIRKKYKVTMKSKEYIIEISGHVDIDYPGDGYERLADIKTTTHVNFNKIMGLMECGSDEYAALKAQGAEGQANSYAVESGHDGKEFDILWMNNSNLDFKVESFITKKTNFNDTLIKLATVLEAIDKYKEGDEEARPPFAGIANCSVCRHYRIHCLGKDAVTEGQTRLSQFIPPEE
jgi:hypothetical protein